MKMIQVPRLTLEDARIAVEACKKKAIEICVPMDIAVCDDGGNLVAFERMDGALVGAIQIAIDKAYTSATWGSATAEEGNMAQPGGPEYGANTLCGGRIVILGGGIPIKLKNVTLGAVGCSSGAAEQDIAVADAGVRILVEKLANQ
jgi:uncharacterized protein GlcG (DUF336 family)